MRRLSIARRATALFAAAVSTLAAAPTAAMAAPGAPTQLNAADMTLLNGVRQAGLWEMPAGQMATDRGSTARVRQVGEAIAAHVEAEPTAGLTAAAVRDHVGSRLSGYKVPKVVVFDDNLPREETGKIFKRRIRQRYWQDAGRNI